MSDIDTFVRELSVMLASGRYAVGMFVAVAADGESKGVIVGLTPDPIPLHPLTLLGAATQQVHMLVARAAHSADEDTPEEEEVDDDDDGN